MAKPDLAIKAFGIELRPLEKKDLSILCHWRNQPEILPYMDVAVKISMTNLTFWFEKIREYKNVFPWLVYHGETPAGYTELKEINYAEKSCADGIFLFGEKYFGTGLNYRIVLCREIMMRNLALETLFSYVRPNNQRGVRFCVRYGGEMIGKRNGFNIYKYECLRREEKLSLIASSLNLKQEYDKLLG